MLKLSMLFKSKSKAEDVRISPLGREVTRGEAVTAAAARVATDKARGRQSEAWIVQLASEAKS